ncbi:MAG TPA: hypothetical protein VM925_29770 [Labilithrix sp.]|nr:hypothetical protein [Labilithrix sp.]
MSTDRRRYTRQMRLAEIGEAGQAKLCAASVELGSGGFAKTVEERYARGAGMSVAAPGGGRSAVAVDALGLRHDAAREVAEGALSALVSFRAVLGRDR